MLNVKPLSQRDSVWGGELLGFNTDSRYNIYSYGCLLCCLAMGANWYGRRTDPGKLNELLKKLDKPKGFSDGGYYVWNSLTRLYPEIIEKRRITKSVLTDDQMAEIFKWLDNGHPVILHIDMFPETAPCDMHFVLAVGYNKEDENDIQIADPWTGTIRSLYDYLRLFKKTARGTIEQYIGLISEPPESFESSDSEPSEVSSLLEQIDALETKLEASTDKLNDEVREKRELQEKMTEQTKECQKEATKNYLAYEEKYDELYKRHTNLADGLLGVLKLPEGATNKNILDEIIYLKEGGATEMPKKMISKGKALIQSKTFWFNALSLIVAIASLFGFADFEPNPEIAKATAAIIAVVNIALRIKTNQVIDRLK